MKLDMFFNLPIECHDGFRHKYIGGEVVPHRLRPTGETVLTPSMR